MSSQVYPDQHQLQNIENGENRGLNQRSAGSGGNNGHNQQQQQENEQIPLQRLNSTERRTAEATERQRIYNLFVQYDTNSDNRLNVKELKDMITNGMCREMSKGLSHHILRMHDHNGDGYLSFEEFYTLSQNNKWLINSLLNQYCSLVIPSPHRAEGDQIDGAYEQQMKFCPPPLTMIVFSIIEIIFFLVDVFHFQDDPTNIKKVGENTDGPVATLFIYNPYRRYEAWRFITYMFVHVGVMHLFMNLVIQVFLGVALELVHHWWRVSLVYLAGVAAGSMGTSLTSPHIYLAGASGGVYALITAHIATIIMNWKEMEFAIVQLFVFLIFCFTDLGTSIYRHVTEQHDKIGYVAHLCGAIAGLLVGIGVLRNLKVNKWEKILWWFAVLVYFALMATGVLIHILYPDYFPKSFKGNYH